MHLLVSQVVWAACFGFIPCHEADILWKCDVGHLLFQQTEGWSNLQSVLSSHPKSRFECSAYTVLSEFYKSCLCYIFMFLPLCWNHLFPLISIMLH